MNLVAIDKPTAEHKPGAERKSAAKKIQNKKNDTSRVPKNRVDFAFLDSGTGGLPYLLHLKEKSPHSNCVYVADTKNFPYGEKDTPRIIEAACSAAESIIKRFKPAAFVIGCNTISVTALEELRRRFFPVPFVGTVPAIKRAASLTKNGRIGLLATRRTIEEPYTAELAERYAANCTLISRADPDLVDFVEHGFFTASDAEKEEAVRPALDFFLKHDADTVVLGCTHFLHVAPVLEKCACGRIRFVDSKEGVVNQALRIVRPAAPSASAESTAADPKPSPSAFFITGPSGIDEAPYKLLCERSGLLYGGIL